MHTIIDLKHAFTQFYPKCSLLETMSMNLNGMRLQMSRNNSFCHFNVSKTNQPKFGISEAIKKTIYTILLFYF